MHAQAYDCLFLPSVFADWLLEYNRPAEQSDMISMPSPLSAEQ